MSVKIGDYVTVRPAKHPNALGIGKVLEFGKTADGQDAAKLNGGMFGEFNVLVEDLTVEDTQ